MSWRRKEVQGVKPPSRFGHATVLIGSLLFLFGGQDDERQFDDLWVLDTGIHTYSPTTHPSFSTFLLL